MTALIDKIRRRIQKSILQYGLVVTIARCLAWPAMYLSWKLVELSPASRRDRLAGERYDADFGVDTCRDRTAEWAADIESEHWAEGLGYDPTPPDTVRQSIGRLQIHHEDFCFIDLGCGKGRVVLVASEFPFAKVIGVEYAPDLTEIAEQNRVSFSNPARRCPEMEFHCHDAVTFPLPRSPLVLFFAHPFGDAITRKFLDGVQQSLAAHPRKIYVIYYDPICGSIFEDYGFREHESQDLEAHTGIIGFVATHFRWFETIGFRNRLGKEYVVYETP